MGRMAAVWLLLLVACSAMGMLVLVRGQDRNPAGFINIDCGAPSDYRNEILQLDYKTDDGFVDSGIKVEKVDIQEEISEDVRQQVQTLRYFPDGKRNCYTIITKEGKGNTYLIRAWFYYGNYDQKAQASVFDLHIGVTYWWTVRSTSLSYTEVVYFSTTDYIQVCLINTGGGIPFISALELRLLDNSTYHQPGLPPLVSNWRYDIGGSERNYRYPTDVFDRIWWGKFYNWENVSTDSTSALTKLNDDPYKVPPEVLRTAQKATSISLGWPSSSTKRWCIYFHFAELENLPSDQQREFSIQFADEDIGPNVVLVYLTPKTVDSTIQNSTAMNLTIRAANNSASNPPILNAIEFFNLLDHPDVPTAQGDVDAINGVKKAYSLYRSNWQGDPCVPNSIDYMWDGLNYTYVDDLTRIISLNLSSRNLRGLLDPSLSNLFMLESLDMSHNNLTGHVPDFSTLTNLRFLDLTGNNLKGSVPRNLLTRANNRTVLDLRLADNPDLCLVGCNRKNKLMVRVGAPLAGLVFLLFVGCIIWIIGRKQGKRKAGASLKSKSRRFTYEEVLSITDNLMNCIGEGGFGKVYSGALANGTKVAVKMLRTSSQGYKEFESEAQPLMIIHHKNLVDLFGYCDDPKNMALIYELMEKGDLRKHLSDEPGLTWKERVQIALDAAQGLDYLHNGCKPPIIHRDLKPPNILLDENMQAKIADFGLSRSFLMGSNSHISTCPAGTIGYLDPECRNSGHLGRKSDVYSFGIILFELITGQPAVMSTSSGKIHILQWVTPIIERGDIKSIVDPRLTGEYEISSAWKLVETAMSCVPPAAIQRPGISEVLAELKACWAVVTASERRLSGSFELTYANLNQDSAPAAR